MLLLENLGWQSLKLSLVSQTCALANRIQDSDWLIIIKDINTATSDTRLYAASSLKIPLGTSLALAFFVRCLSIYNKSILFHRKEAAHAVHHHIRSNLFLLSRWPTIKAGRFSALSRHT
jgi:hypothetical protein